MTDGLDALRRANPTTPEAVEPLVAMDRQTLMSMLEADDEDRGRPDVVVRLSPRSTRRVGYVAAMAVAAAAALVVGVSMTGTDVTPTELDPAGSTDPAPITSPPLVVEGVDEATSTTVEPGPGAASPIQDESPATTDTDTETKTAGTKATDQPPAPARADGPFDASVDLLALHYDHAHLDDGQAAAADREVATSFGLDPLIVAGTRPVGDDGHRQQLEPVMQAVWGDDWLNAQLDRAGAVGDSADRWLATIDRGGRVWVAEGGVADFTAEVVREIQARRPELDTRTALRVVQHNGYNESESTAESLRLVKANTGYERIDDGNSTNGTADLNQPSSGFEAVALAGRHPAGWAAAFEHLPATRLDFSDTVEVLHILGVGIDEVADPDDFADRFMR